MMKNISKEKELPGDFGIWIVIYIELVTFAALFIGYAFARRADVALFNESQLLLNQASGFINTLVLITSSYFIVQAVRTIKELEHKKASKFASRWLLAAMGMGFVFIVMKILEFSNKFEQGINLSTNTFFMFYILLTAFHFIHVILGLFILFVVYKKTKTGGYSSEDHAGMLTGASYWHLIDLLWIVLFPLIYIIR